ncbi:hypothetical protein F5883DRAFT_615265 [Diaporthe sp. PMI_573]|jgi:hypothetical protein|nr:hypothetical protein F5883DRAFT_615265 [Diaporthaceae sp. PMI_573]
MAPHLSVPDFLEYIRAFNDTDYDKQHSFYADDVKLVIPDPAIGTLEGKAGIRKHYQPIHAAAKEKVIPLIVMSDRGRVFLKMDAYFLYEKEVEKAVHDYHVYPGDVVKISNCAIYDLDEEGKMKTIHCYLFQQELLGKVDLKGCIRDSESRADPDLRLYNY